MVVPTGVVVWRREAQTRPTGLGRGRVLVLLASGDGEDNRFGLWIGL